MMGRGIHMAQILALPIEKREKPISVITVSYTHLTLPTIYSV